MSESYNMRVERFNLGNVSSLLDEQVDGEIQAVVNAFNNPDGFETGKLKAEITIKLSFEHNTDRHTTGVVATVTTTLPKRKPVTRPLIMREDGFLIEPEDEQLALLAVTNKSKNNANNRG